MKDAGRPCNPTDDRPVTDDNGNLLDDVTPIAPGAYISSASPVLGWELR